MIRRTDPVPMEAVKRPISPNSSFRSVPPATPEEEEIEAFLQELIAAGHTWLDVIPRLPRDWRELASREGGTMGGREAFST